MYVRSQTKIYRSEGPGRRYEKYTGRDDKSNTVKCICYARKAGYAKCDRVEKEGGERKDGAAMNKTRCTQMFQPNTD